MKFDIVKLHRYRGFFLFLMPAILVLGSMAFLLGESLFLSDEEQRMGKWLWQNIFPRALGNTLALTTWVVIGTLLVGVFQAFVVVFANLPCRKLLNILFILPLSFPLYVIAFVYVGLFEFGNVITLDSRASIAFVFILSLSPYVYLLSKGAFQEVGLELIRSGKVLGYSSVAIFFKVILPYSYPWLFVGAALVALETLADFGGVAVFNYDTLTTAIYGTWKSLFSLSLASRLALVLAFLALMVFGLESFLFKRGTYVSAHKLGENMNLFHFSLLGKSLLLAVCMIWVVLSLLLPLGQLAIWGWAQNWGGMEKELLFNTFTFALVGAGLISLWALGMVLFSGRDAAAVPRPLRHLSLMGYGLPGTLMGVAVFAFFSQGLGLSPGQGGLLFLLFGYAVRFLNVGFRPINVAAGSMPLGRERAARMLGVSERKILGKVYLPHLKGAWQASFLLIFVEIAKEMPMTLILRSPHQKTLAVKIYELTSEGEWERAAPYGIVLVMLGMLSLILLNKFGERIVR